MNELNSTKNGEKLNPKNCVPPDNQSGNATGTGTKWDGTVAFSDPNDRWCPPGNTAPSNSQFPRIKVAFDYLVCWIYGSWTSFNHEIIGVLNKKKEKARQTQESQAIQVCGNVFLVHGNGSRGPGIHRCQFLLKNNGITYGLTENQNLKKEPIGKIEIPGIVLCQNSFNSIWNSAKSTFESFGFQYSRSKISRLDIKADQFDFPIDIYHEAVARKRVISLLRKFGTEGTVDETETLNFGKRKNKRVCLRIYDKLKELLNDHNKMALFLEFVTEGERLDDCTRIEFEVLREGFKHLQIDSLEDCIGNLEKVVSYLTHDLFRIAGHDVDRTHTSRAKNADYWDEVTSALEQFAKQFPHSKTSYQKTVLLDPQQHISQVIGYLLSWIALTGTQISTTKCLKQFVNQNLFPVLGDVELLKKLQAKKMHLEHELGIKPSCETSTQLKRA